MKKFKGIFVATITPFGKDLEVDFELIESHVNFLIDKGIHGLVVCGTNGEFASLTTEERKKIIETSIDTAKGRVPVFTGANSSSVKESIELTKFSEEIGATATIITTPFFFRKASEQGIYNFFSSILDETPKKFPIFLLNVPIYSLIEIKPELIEALLKKYKNIVGIKDLSGNPDSITAYCGYFPNLSVLVGSDRLAFHGLNVGCDGVVSAIANILPEYVLDIYHTFQKGDRDSAWIKQESLAGIRSLMKRYPSRGGFKFLFSKISGKESFVRPPLRDLMIEEKESLMNVLNEHGLFLEQEITC